MHIFDILATSAIVLAIFDGLFKASAQRVPMLNDGCGIAKEGGIFWRENRIGLVHCQNIHNEVAI